MGMLFMLAVPLQAGAQTPPPGPTNTVTIYVSGANATAVAACANIALQGNLSEADQVNKCDNDAKAVGGEIEITGLEIVQVVKGAPTSPAPANTTAITVTGANAKALAVCLNLAKQGRYGLAWQKNNCDNEATAIGGEITIHDVEITQVIDPKGKKHYRKH